jgi:hypothetical protein
VGNLEAAAVLRLSVQPQGCPVLLGHLVLLQLHPACAHVRVIHAPDAVRVHSAHAHGLPVPQLHHVPHALQHPQEERCPRQHHRRFALRAFLQPVLDAADASRGAGEGLGPVSVWRGVHAPANDDPGVEHKRIRRRVPLRNGVRSCSMTSEQSVSLLCERFFFLHTFSVMLRPQLCVYSSSI